VLPGQLFRQELREKIIVIGSQLFQVWFGVSRGIKS
jgi:hypothetical protein